MSSRRRRLDPVGPFGNPDGSRADIDDLISEFVDFGGNPAYGHLATRANDSMVRVIVGKLGAGKTVYLRRLQDFQSHQDSVYADVPQQSLPKTEVIVKACQWFSDSVLVEKWMQIWERAIMRSLASHLLRRPELRQQVPDEQALEIEQSYARLLDDFRRPRSIYSQVRDIINQQQTAHQLSKYLDDPLWDDLEDLLGEVVGACKPIYFYLDAVDEEFSHAPMYWLRCQEGLFYQVMRLLRDPKLGGRLHVVICIRDIVMSSVYRSEHAPRYYNEPHIRVLNWEQGTLLYLLGQKLQRLPSSLLMRRPASGPPTIRDWLGVNGSWPGPDGEQSIEDYLLSHTRLIPRDIISLGNELSEEVLRQKQAGRDGLPAEALTAVVQRCAKRFGDSQLAQCANQISSDLMPQHAALHNYSELFTSTQAYITGVQEDIRSFVRMIGADRFSRADLVALQEVADLHFEKATDLASVLWQNGLLGYVDETGRRRFYSMGDIEEFHFPPEVSTYVLHPCLVHAVGGIQHVSPDAAADGDIRHTRPLVSGERSDAPAETSATPPDLSSSHALPEPDASEVRYSTGAKAAEYAAGDVIEDRFHILQVLGQGSFSKVYRVRDDVEGEERALKLFDNAAGYEAVRREIGALRKIQHPNVVKVFWAGKTKADDWYLITEFIDGESLDEYVTGTRRLRDREAVDVALDLLDALVAFHPDAARLSELEEKRRHGDLPPAQAREWTELTGKGLVHRDIKPLNVMLTRRGAKLLDFNIASRVGDPVHTQSGTPPYQPPDAGLDRWDVSTDLFAVGVVLYRLLCDGQHPYPQARPTMGGSVIDPLAVRPDLDPGLADFLVRACAPASADRFATAAEMRLALRSVRAELLPARPSARAAGLVLGHHHDVAVRKKRSISIPPELDAKIAAAAGAAGVSCSAWVAEAAGRSSPSAPAWKRSASGRPSTACSAPLKSPKPTNGRPVYLDRRYATDHVSGNTCDAGCSRRSAGADERRVARADGRAVGADGRPFGMVSRLVRAERSPRWSPRPWPCPGAGSAGR
jgi:serine/threonine protein kinase